MGILEVPKIREPVRKIRYLCHLSQTFRGIIFQGTERIPESSQVYFYLGHDPEEGAESPDYTRTQAREKSALYTRSHLNKLRPAQAYEYLSYFAFAGRADLQLGYIEEGIPPHPGQSIYLFAFNIYEVKRVRIEFPAALMIFHVQQGRAQAAIFELPAQEVGLKYEMIRPDRR